MTNSNSNEYLTNRLIIKALKEELAKPSTVGTYDEIQKDVILMKAEIKRLSARQSEIIETQASVASADIKWANMEAAYERNAKA